METTKIELVNLWKLTPDERVAAVAGFQLPGGQQSPETFAQHAVVVARHEGKPVALSTAEPVFLKRLDGHFYFYRHRLIPASETLYFAMIGATKSILEKAFVGARDAPIGMVMVIQSEFVKKNRRKAVWRGNGLTYIGDTEQGHHIRLVYFHKARI